MLYPEAGNTAIQLLGLLFQLSGQLGSLRHGQPRLVIHLRDLLHVLGNIMAGDSLLLNRTGHVYYLALRLTRRLVNTVQGLRDFLRSFYTTRYQIAGLLHILVSLLRIALHAGNAGRD